MLKLNFADDSLFKPQQTNKRSFRTTCAVTLRVSLFQDLNSSVPAYCQHDKRPSWIRETSFLVKEWLQSIFSKQDSPKVILLLAFLFMSIFFISFLVIENWCWEVYWQQQRRYLRSRSSVSSVGFCWAFSGVGWEACSCSKRSLWISWRISLHKSDSQWSTVHLSWSSNTPV